MKNIKQFKIFESADDDVRMIYTVEDYLVEVLDRYKDRIKDWKITEFLADPKHGDIYKSKNSIINGVYKEVDVSESAPDGSLLTYDISMEIKNENEDTFFGWEGFCDFETFSSVISDIKSSMNRISPKHIYVQVSHTWDTHTIVMSTITNKIKK